MCVDFTFCLEIACCKCAKDFGSADLKGEFLLQRGGGCDKGRWR